MRWITKPIPRPQHGQERERKVFAWRRTRVGKHTVWLEFYRVHEVYNTVTGCGRGWWDETTRCLLDYYV